MTDLTGLSLTVTVPSGGRRVRVTGFGTFQGDQSASEGYFRIREGSTALGQTYLQCKTANDITCIYVTAIIPAATATAGAHTYKLSWLTSSGGGSSFKLVNTLVTSYILVEYLGGV